MPSIATAPIDPTPILHRESWIDLRLTSAIDTLLGFVDSQLSVIYLDYSLGYSTCTLDLGCMGDYIRYQPRDLDRAARQISQMPGIDFSLWYISGSQEYLVVGW